MTLTQGSRLGTYEIVGAIGAGGMGVVYRARDTRLHREVAIKVLPELFARDRERLLRFEHEAQALAALNHPHIAQIYGVEDSGGVPALVMELVDGPTLADRIARGPIPFDEALPISCQIADALEAAHEKGIVHRDLKPANIKLRPDGTVKVLDFGLAKLATPDARSDADVLNSPTLTNPATQAGMILGTAAYMAPEQARGKPVDRRTDIWAFACVLYEMLAGRPPFTGETITDIIAAIVHKEVDYNALPASTPEAARNVLRRAFQKDPKKRLRDIGDARLQLEETSAFEHPAVGAPVRSHKEWIAMALVALAVGALLGWSVRTPAPEQADLWTGTMLGGPSLVGFPRISPDGQLLAFGTLVDGLMQVAVMKPESGNWTVLTRDRTHGYVATISWSTDGTRVYYDRWFDRSPAIYSVPALGGDERLVLENAQGPQPLADGSLLVVRMNQQRQYQLHRFSPGTGQVQELGALIEVGGDLASMRSLPGSQETVFFGRPLAAAEGSVGLYVMNLQSGAARRIAQDVRLRPSANGMLPITVTPADGTILVATQEDNIYRVLHVASSGAEPTRPLLMFHAVPFLDAARDGTLYIALRERPVELLRIALTGGTATTVITSAVFAPRGGGIAPLPDGRVIVGAHLGGRDRLLVAGVGRAPVPLVDSSDDTSAPATAVGKDRVAFLIGPEDAREIAIASIVDGRIVRRFKSPGSGAASFGVSPSGDILYYAAAGSIWAMPVEGGAARKIGRGDSLAVDPQSGDLIVKIDDPDRYALLRMSPDGKSEQPITINSDLRLTPRLLTPGAVRNGRLLLPVGSNDSWYWSVGLLDLRTGAITKIPLNDRLDFHGATWTHDGAVLGVGLDTRGPLWRFRRIERTE